MTWRLRLIWPSLKVHSSPLGLLFFKVGHLKRSYYTLLCPFLGFQGAKSPCFPQYCGGQKVATSNQYWTIFTRFFWNQVGEGLSEVDFSNLSITNWILSQHENTNKTNTHPRVRTHDQICNPWLVQAGISNTISINPKP
jgi:hypothetical protein